ncbi:hypothetical protein [Flagellimonas allohymeniacidonis]|uniref:Uncharacterized protein n=1 Tax=Flagellimonas allohymeniacidonis TaxID=2517819 RepID=A0A4Q8QCN6_9FLAO|nr:hypothetical protein [Allomuricauda hymeniacidonis]TAI47207.1 hypothetical protein EW142_11015 [Allomuricauda hymeniacidonis]
MHLITIIWALICALIIISYPIYIYNKSKIVPSEKPKPLHLVHQHTVDLISVDLTTSKTGWSFTVDLPQITQEVLRQCTILFYLETDETCLKLPLNNASKGYVAEIFKNVGKIYLTFKCLADGVSNYHVPMEHLQKLKVLVIKNNTGNSRLKVSLKKSILYQKIKDAGVNINMYEDTLIYLSNMADIDFKGYKTNVVKLSELQELSSAV